MKSTLLVLLTLLSAGIISAQLAITPGAQFSIAGNTRLTLQNTDLVNDGQFITGAGTIRFSGDASSSITGSQPVEFFELELNKTTASMVILQRTIKVSQRILFSSGFLNLNGFNADLGSTGHLDGEQENTRAIGPTGGEILFNTNLNSPTGSNPANLGVFITSGKNLGDVVIRRGHRSQATGTGNANSALRYYDIAPLNNTDLNGTIRFRYFDAELNGLSENSLALFESQDNINWTNLGSTSRDVTANFVEKTGISTFARFTLSHPVNILPVRFTLFNARCENNKVVLTWKTAQEQNSDHFDIERSVDGTNWTVIGVLPAAGNSSSERTYSFSDNNPLQNGFYRIAEVDADGSLQYTGILRSSCNAADVFRVWPNPVHETLFINITSAVESPAVIKLFDSKGALVKQQQIPLLQGSNQFNVDMKTYANGIYTVSVSWNFGQNHKTAQLIKQ